MYFPTLDIKDAFEGSFTMRRLLVVINRLLGMHGRSALSVAVLGVGASWSNEEYMLAASIDEAKYGNYLTMQINGAANQSLPPFTNYLRPGQSREDLRDDVLSTEPSMEFASGPEVAGVLSRLTTGTFL